MVLGDARPGVPPLVVVPGLGALGYLLPTLRRSAGWTQVHLLDLPGFGHRDTARLPADLATVSRVLTAWLEEVAQEPVLLLGHSTGAQVALRAAVAAPARVRSLVLGGVVFPPGRRTLTGALRGVLRALPHERPGELPATFPYYLRGARRLPELVRSGLRDRPEDLVPSLRVPLLVVRGEHDALCPPSWAALLAERAPRGLVQVVPGGHNSVWTHPVETDAALRGALG
ncbi:MAG: hypothetical protein JWM64_1735 [Frankiales bacterium]|nr:hypothetical protein [Frankiales bacterium]